MNTRDLDPRAGDRRHVWLAAGALGLLGFLGLLGLLAVGAFIGPARPAELGSPGANAAPEALASRATLPTTVAARDEPGVRALSPAADPPPSVPSEPHEVAPDLTHAHPVTPAHLRIYRENNLLGALNGAMDVKDASGMRRLLAQYAAEYPEDAHGLAQGYEIIADCLENPGEASTAAARRYYDTETASTLRRYVRRHCFEPGP